MQRYLITFLMVGGIMLSSLVTHADEPPVGWFFLYPLMGEGEDVMPETAPTTLATLAGNFHRMYKEGGIFDPNDLKKQLDYAYQYKLNFGIISESNPLFCAPWMMEEIAPAGEAIKDFYGKDGGYASIRSPIFNRYQDDLIEKTVGFVKDNDPENRLKYYHAGGEWWFPDATRYNNLDIAAFRQWMKTKYPDIATVNARWQAKYGSFDEIHAPLVEVAYMGPIWGKHRFSKMLSRENGSQFCAWSTTGVSAPVPDPDRDTCPQVIPGQRYTFSAFITSSHVAGQGAQLQIGWIPKGGDGPSRVDITQAVTGNSDWKKIEGTFEAPEDAERAWLLLTLTGTGKACFDELFFGVEGSGENLAPDPDFEWADRTTSGWAFFNWSAGESVQSQYKQGGVNKSHCLELAIDRSDLPEQTYANQEAAIYDWDRFWFETAAKAVNDLSAKFRRLDPTRQTICYMTNAWTLAAEWDEAQRHAILPDEVARHAKDIDAFGLQLCSADGDPFRITSVLDMVRKYGKPMWDVDLIDFTSGVHIGAPTLNKMTQTAIQHGSSGLIYCGWNIPFAQDYNYHPKFGNPTLKAMLDDARTSIKAVQGLAIQPDCAIVLPFMPASPADPEYFKNDPASYMGCYKILEEMHLTVDVITLFELEHGDIDLSVYPWIMVPDCPYLPSNALETLTAHAKEGGKIITGGRFAEFDEIARPIAPERVAAIAHTAFTDYGHGYAGARLRDTHAGNTPPLFLWRKETPQTSEALAKATSDIQRYLEALNLQPESGLKGPAQNTRLVKFGAENTRAFFLVNLGETTTGNGTIHLRFRSGNPSGLTVLADGKPVECSMEAGGDWTTVALPSFAISCIVKVDSREPETTASDHLKKKERESL